MATTTYNLKGTNNLAGYLSANPNANIQLQGGQQQLMQDPRIQQLIQQQQQQAQQAEQARLQHEADYGGLGGFLRGAVEGVVDPFLRLGRVADVGLNDLMGNDAYAQQAQDRYFGKDANLGEQGLRGLLGVGSYLVPGVGAAGGLVNLATRGIAGGALGALSNQNFMTEGVDINKILEGGALGGAVGGGLGLLGKGFKGLTGAGKAASEVGEGIVNTADNAAGGLRGKLYNLWQSLEAKPLNIQAELTPTGIQGADALKKQMLSILKTNNSPINARGIGDAFGKINNQLSDVLQTTTSKVDPMQVLDNYSNKLLEEGIDLAGTTGKANIVSDQLMSKLQNAGDSASAIAGLKRELDGTMKGIYKKISAGTELSDPNLVRLSFRQSLDDVLKEAVPEARPLYNQLSTLYDAAPNAIKQANKGAFISSPLAIGGIKVPTGGILGKAGQVVGRTLQGQLPGSKTLGNLLQSPAIQGAMSPQGLTNATRMAASVAGRNGLPQEAQQQEFSPLIQQLMQMQQQQVDPMIDPQMQAGMMAQQQQQQPSAAQARAQLFQQLLNEGAKVSEAKTIAEMLVPDDPVAKEKADPKLTENQKKFTSAANLAERALTLLQNDKVSTGRLASLGNRVTEFFDTQSNEQTDYKSKLASARGSAISALSGANVPPSEYERIAAMIPEDTDEPKRAQQKIISFIEAMREYANPDMSSMSSPMNQSIGQGQFI
jgi:hypothetical protein